MEEQVVKKKKVYTRNGDNGYTAISGGQRNISKAHLRIEVCGTIDELNSFIGLSIAAIRQYEQLSSIEEKCLRIQKDLFNLGTLLISYPTLGQEKVSIVNENDVRILENEIDEMDLELPELKNFIFPNSGEVSSRLHVARAICRRLERTLVRLSELVKFDEIIIIYINRLSDWLFVAARYAAMQLKQKEFIKV